MGPFPHDAPRAVISEANPAGTDGFEFVEFAHRDPKELETLFQRMGFTEVARHRTKDISLYRQGRVNYILNREPGGHAARFVAEHGPCAPAMASRAGAIPPSRSGPPRASTRCRWRSSPISTGSAASRCSC